MKNSNPNGPLADLAFELLKIREENFNLKKDLETVINLLSGEKAKIPAIEVFNEIVLINNSEAARILERSNPTLRAYTKFGLLKRHENKKTPSNCYLLNEILWARSQNVRNASALRLKVVARNRLEKFGD